MPRGAHSVYQRSCFTDQGTCFTDEIKPINEFIESNLRSGFANPIDKTDSINKSNLLDGEASAKPFYGWSHKSDEPVYFKYYLIVSKIKAKGIDIDKLLED